MAPSGEMDAADTGIDVEIRPLDGIAELETCVRLQRVVWGIEDVEIVPASQMRAVQHAGGLVAGAFADGDAVGFVYGLPAMARAASSGAGMHSHMLGVMPAYRQRGIGQSLKWFQRAWCLARDVRWVSWTFDPLQGKNAYLNLERLGATSGTYYPDFYGELGGALAADVPTDRLVALWRLDEPHVRGLAEGRAREALPGDVEPALRDLDGLPEDLALDLDARWISIATPRHATTLIAKRRDLARRWREAHRSAFGAYLRRGYVVRRFEHGRYLLQRADDLPADDALKQRRPPD